MKKLLLIINPIAGKKKAAKKLDKIKALLEEGGFEVTARTTEYKGHATEMAEAASDYDLLVCAGGDGTFREMIAGVLKSGRSDQPLGYLPCGSTNDFGVSLGLPKKLMQAAKNLITGVPTPIDLGRFGGENFSYIASFGAFTRASFRAPQKLKNAVGHFAYILEGLRSLDTIKKYHLRAETERGVFEDDYILGAVSNSFSVAGILKLDKSMADLSDGLLELLLIRYPKNAKELFRIVRALLSRKYNIDNITFFSTDHILITGDPEMSWTFDGEEVKGIAESEAYNLHHAITLLLPRDARPASVLAAEAAAAGETEREGSEQ